MNELMIQQRLSPSEMQLYHLNKLIQMKNIIIKNNQQQFDRENTLVVDILKIISVEKRNSLESPDDIDVIVKIHLDGTLIRYLITRPKSIEMTVMNIIVHIRNQMKKMVEEIIHNNRRMTMKHIHFITMFVIDKINPITTDINDTTNVSTKINYVQLNAQLKNMVKFMEVLLENTRPYQIAIDFSTESVTLEDQLFTYIFFEGLDKGIIHIRSHYVKTLYISFHNINFVSSHDRLHYIFIALANYVVRNTQGYIIDNIVLDLKHNFMTYYTSQDIFNIINIVNLLNYRYHVFGNYIIHKTTNINTFELLKQYQSGLISHALKTDIMPIHGMFDLHYIMLDFSDANIDINNIVVFTNAIEHSSHLRYLVLPRIDISNIHNTNIRFLYNIYLLILTLVSKTLNLQISISQLEEVDDNTFSDVVSTYIKHQSLFHEFRMIDLKESISGFDNNDSLSDDVSKIQFEKHNKLSSQSKSLNKYLIWTVSSKTTSLDIDYFRMLIYNDEVLRLVNNSSFILEDGLAEVHDQDRKIRKSILYYNRIKILLELYVQNYDILSTKKLLNRSMYTLNQDDSISHTFEFI